MSSRLLKEIFCKQLVRINLAGSQTPMFLNNFKHTLIDNETLDVAADMLMKKSLENNNNFSALCPVHAPAMPLTSVLATKMKIPILESSDGGPWHKNILRKRIISVEYEDSRNCLLIQDCVKSGRLTYKKVQDISLCGIRCRDVGVFVDFGQGGVEYLRSKDLNVYSLITMAELTEFLRVGFHVKPNVHFSIKYTP